MSRIYWHSRHGEAELRGSERAWLDFVIRGPAAAAWDLDRGANNLEQAARIMELIPKTDAFIHEQFQRAIEEKQAIGEYYRYMYPTNSAERKGPRPRSGDRRLIEQFIESLKMHAASNFLGTVFVVTGHEIDSWKLGFNTAIAIGSDIVRLAVKIHSKCEVHGFVEGKDRQWLSDIIADGQELAIYRPDAGWDEVRELLLSRDDEPVVMSYSACEQFPNPYIADWEPPADQRPVGIGEDEWAEATDEQRREWQMTDLWYELGHDVQWDLAIKGLRTKRPFNRIAPETLGTMIDPGLTIYDLFAPDRDERVEAIFRGTE